MLQALVHHHILKGVRGPRGGYALAREPNRISAEEILRATGTVDNAAGPRAMESVLLDKVVLPAIAQAENVFSQALAKINLADLTRNAAPFKTIS